MNPLCEQLYSRSWTDFSKQSNTAAPSGAAVFSFNIQFYRHVDLVGDILSVFLPLADTLGEQLLDLTVYRAEIVLRPGSDGGIQLGREPQRNLLLVVSHGITRGT